MHARLLLVATLACATALAGCASQADRDPGAASVPVATSESEPALLAPERPASSEATWREEPSFSVKDDVAIAAEGYIMENQWEPRDVAFTYHGVQQVYDEWGRTIAAHVYRYPEMEVVITEVEFLGAGEVQVTARYEPGMTEFAFAAADGRYLGPVDVKHQVRAFGDARYPMPYAGGYAADLMLPVAFQALDGDLSRPVEFGFGTVSYQPTDRKPLDGDCTPHEAKVDYADWFEARQDEMAEDDPEELLPEEEQVQVVCLQEQGQPLWVYSGNQSDHLVLRRLTDPVQAPKLSGAPLAPDAIATRPMEELELLLGLAKPILVPPSASPGDWADQLRPVAAALPTGLDYMQWQLDREPIYLTDASLGWPFTGPLLPLPLSPAGGLAFDRTSWIMVADGESMHWAFIDSRYGGPEDEDVHLNRYGSTFDDYRTSMTDTVASGEVQARWERELPPDPRVIDYSTFPDLEDVPPQFVDYLLPFLRTWHAMEFCFEAHEPGVFASFSAFNGQMLALGKQTSTEHGCGGGVGYDDGFLRLHWGRQELLLRPAQPGVPALLVVPGPSGPIALGGRADAGLPGLA